MADLWIVRHGDAPRYQPGQEHLSLSPLSELGVRQITSASRELRGVFGDDRPDVMYSALSQRSKQTANILAGWAGWAGSIEENPAFEHTIKLSDGLVHLKPVEEVESAIQIWSRKLGIHTTVVAAMSKRAMEIMLSEYMCLDEAAIDSRDGALSIASGSIIRVRLGRGGWVEDVADPPCLTGIQEGS